MRGLRFGLMGDGVIASQHRKAIKAIGGKVKWAVDPVYKPDGFIGDPGVWTDFVVICSPTHLHLEHIKQVGGDQRIIVEKPICLPWEQIPVDTENVSVVLQLRWLPLNTRAKKVSVRMVRDAEYFETWKGDPRMTGGLFYNLFIHYIDLANRLGADFEGIVAESGEQWRMVDDISLIKFDMGDCYRRMYLDIIEGKGVKPRDIQFLHWQLNRNSEMHGYGRECMNKKIIIKNEIG